VKRRILYSYPVKLTLLVTAGILAISILQIRKFVEFLPRQKHS
jgi:hypothetical protein